MLRSWLARQAYSLLLRLGTPFYLWRVWSRGQVEPTYRACWWERLGFYRREYRASLAEAAGGRPLYWLHAVSLGETRAVAPLLQALRENQPGMRLLLTHGTATGREAGKALLKPGDLQTWFPYDTPGAVRRFLRLHQPKAGILMETEVWPNVQHEALKAKVPMVLANARLSEKSLRQGMRLSALMKPAAQSLSLVLAQTEDDAKRLSAMGSPRVEVCGNVKFDMTPSPALLDQGARWRAADERPIVLAASTREGEEAGLLSAWRAALSEYKDIHRTSGPRLWIVPRHPQRFDEVAALVTQCGLSLSRRSAWPDSMPDVQALKSDIWLGDSLGEMAAYYSAARVALLGGSFVPLGGQNLIEAAACGCPIVMGPSTFNFSDAALLSEAAGAAFRVKDWPEALEIVKKLTQTELGDQCGQYALAFSQEHRGASSKMVSLICGMEAPLNWG